MEPQSTGTGPVPTSAQATGPAVPPAAEAEVTVGSGSGDGERRLSPRVMLIWRIPSLVMGVIMLLLTLVVVIAGAMIQALLLGAAAVLMFVWGTVVQNVRYRSWSYRVGPDQLDIRRGILVRREATIPYFRVQHIDLHRGPLERLRNIAVLQISTASAATDATLPGIDPADADRLRAYILARAGLEDGV